MSRLTLAVASAVTFVALGFVFPAIALLRTQGQSLLFTALPLIAGTAAITLAIVAIAHQFRRRATATARQA